MKNVLLDATCLGEPKEAIHSTFFWQASKKPKINRSATN